MDVVVEGILALATLAKAAVNVTHSSADTRLKPNRSLSWKVT
jgi:hypothetical protein